MEVYSSRKQEQKQKQTLKYYKLSIYKNYKLPERKAALGLPL